MSWVLILLTVWVLVAIAAAVVIGRSVCFADAEAEAAGHDAPDPRWQRAGLADTAFPGTPERPHGVSPSAPQPAAGDAVRRASATRRRPTFRGCIGATGRTAAHRGRKAA